MAADRYPENPHHQRLRGPQRGRFFPEVSLPGAATTQVTRVHGH